MTKGKIRKRGNEVEENEEGQGRSQKKMSVCVRKTRREYDQRTNPLELGRRERWTKRIVGGRGETKKRPKEGIHRRTGKKEKYRRG